MSESDDAEACFLFIHSSSLPSQEYEKQLQPLLDENDNEVFWPELSSRLAKRDLAKEGKTSATQDKAMMIFFEVKGEYEQKFDENGLSNLELRKS